MDAAKGTPYATDKIRWHPEALRRMGDNEHPPSPITVHFMPMLACNQHCTFCAYGHRVPEDPEEERGWKNMLLMSEASMSWEKALECIDCFERMGVRALEITGGGEPLIWPHIDKLLDRLRSSRLETALVTNGTALTAQRGFRWAATNWKWARVSIDAGTVEQYVATRRVPESHWAKAWEAVRSLAVHRSRPEQKVGVGYVVDHHNFSGIYQAALLARAHGADNIRISFCFSPMGPGRLPDWKMQAARDQARAAVEKLHGERFQVVNLLEERYANTVNPVQDYDFCGAKEVLCVVGADLNAYYCCTLAFNPLGLIGSFAEQTFEQLWRSENTEALFKAHCPRTDCRMECLYERRNLNILNFLRDSKAAAVTDDEPEPLHVNFV